MEALVVALVCIAAIASALAAPAHADRSNARLASGEAIAKAKYVVSRLQLAAFADSYSILDCDRLSTRRVTCRYVLDFTGRIPSCRDRITLTTRWTRGERYIGWRIGKDAIECSAGLDVAPVEIAPAATRSR